MGDVGRGGDANGVAVMGDERPSSTYDNTSHHQRHPGPDPDPSSIKQENLGVAEETALEVLDAIHPTMDSEEKRKDVIDYVQRIIRNSLGFEVFPYGSVPLKTYLPDGDIDLTIFSSPYVEEFWASDVLSILQREEQNENAEYEVKDTQFIDAEVKLVKCLAQNIVIDISFNQLGGLCTLCFLEQVDRLVGKDHLFKRSIILIKAWCYYESRILGAHHGLISTYALETLVLYIFHLFHSSLHGPFAVLYRFLDYFSKFDWENYCISLNGPVCKSSLPEIVAQTPHNEGTELLLSDEFLRNCMEMFSVRSRDLETNSRLFLPKHLNIIDPLKEYNNLGRSVHRGNFYRIRSAFKYGARRLEQILSLPKDEIADEIQKFFGNTLQMHGRNCGSDTQDYALLFGEGSSTLYSSSPAAVLSEDDMLLRSSTSDLESDGLLMEGHYNSVQLYRCSSDLDSLQTMSEPGYSLDGTPVSRYLCNGDSCDLAKHNSLDFRTSNVTSDYSPYINYSGSGFGQYHHLSQLYLPKSYAENGHCSQTYSSDGEEDELGLDQWLEQKVNHLDLVDTSQSCADSLDGFCSCSSAVSSPRTNILENLLPDIRERDSGSVVDAEPLNPLANLSGDYDSHIRSLLYGQCCNGFALSAPGLSNPSVLRSRFGNKKPWDTVRHSMPLKQGSFSQMNSSTTIVGSPASSHAPPVSAFPSEEKHKARGTGTYLPIKNCSSRDRPSQGRPRFKATGTPFQSERHTQDNGFVPAFMETNSLPKGGRELLHAWCPVQPRTKSGVSCQSLHSKAGDTCANGFSNSMRRIEFGSLGNLADDVILAPCNACLLSSNNQKNATPDLTKEEARVADQLFGLENEDEFPPLSL
ncbi:uncharacterized protein [Coffea arabica]|uniref:Uncharacterized protein n=1 Tax=Coffea arabica TaxID=13443 RepID=A0A6P6WCI7_COFAR|nr:uncharacterized protein LOC113731334 [Coffea arabica]XP_027112355.1 uncharacterized protein LOC113731334 [Coffea arabica]